MKQFINEEPAAFLILALTLIVMLVSRINVLETLEWIGLVYLKWIFIYSLISLCYRALKRENVMYFSVFSLVGAGLALLITSWMHGNTKWEDLSYVAIAIGWGVILGLLILESSFILSKGLNIIHDKCLELNKNLSDTFFLIPYNYVLFPEEYRGKSGKTAIPRGAEKEQ